MSLPKHTLTIYDHPEPHSHRWSDLELETIKRYAEAYALQAVEALRPVAMTEWQQLDAARLNSEEFSGLYWLAMKYGEVAVGEYEWRQGWNPHGFNLIDGGRVMASEVTHTMPFVKPAFPHGITQKEQGK